MRGRGVNREGKVDRDALPCLRRARAAEARGSRLGDFASALRLQNPVCYSCSWHGAGLAGLSSRDLYVSRVSNLEKSSNDNRNTKNVGAPAPPPARRANTKTPLVVHSSFSNARAFKGGAVVIRFRRLSYALGG